MRGEFLANGANEHSALLLSSSLRIPLPEACTYNLPQEVSLPMALLTELPGISLFLDSHLPIGFRL